MSFSIVTRNMVYITENIASIDDEDGGGIHTCFTLLEKKGPFRVSCVVFDSSVHLLH